MPAASLSVFSSPLSCLSSNIKTLPYFRGKEKRGGLEERKERGRPVERMRLSGSFSIPDYLSGKKTGWDGKDRFLEVEKINGLKILYNS